MDSATQTTVSTASTSTCTSDGTCEIGTQTAIAAPATASASTSTSDGTSEYSSHTTPSAIAIATASDDLEDITSSEEENEAGRGGT